MCVFVYYKKKRVSFASIIKHDINNSLRTLFLSFGFVFVGARFLSARYCPTSSREQQTNLMAAHAAWYESYKFIMSDKIYYSGGDVGFGLGAPTVTHARAKPNYCCPSFLRQSEIFAPRRERCRRLYQLPADNSLVSTDFASVFWQKPRNSCIKWRKLFVGAGLTNTILALSVICLVIVWWFQWFIHFKLACLCRDEAFYP